MRVQAKRKCEIPKEFALVCSRFSALIVISKERSIQRELGLIRSIESDHNKQLTAPVVCGQLE